MKKLEIARRKSFPEKFPRGKVRNQGATKLAEIISFYSYKGGVGRSLSLANVAALLAQRGKRVVCIDFDLEAGGLHTIFGIEPRDVSYTLLDLLTAIRPRDLSMAMLDISKTLRLASEGRLWLLPTISETDKLILLDSTRDLTTLLGRITDQIVTAYNPHFIFIDSRSGFAELASASISKADRLVCVLRPNRQNAEGLSLLLGILETLPDRRPAFLVLSQVPDLPQTEARLDALKAILGPHRQFGARIPFAPFLALEESVVTITDPLSSFARCYEPIVDWLEMKHE